jgi:hypothetical protein
MEFVQEFEKQSASRKNLLNLRSSKSFVEFIQRWQQKQLPIYYQIRFKEISSSTEEVLADPNLLTAPIIPSKTDTFSLRSTNIIFSSIQRCWTPEIFLFGLVHRFWKLTLQVLFFLSSFSQQYFNSSILSFLLLPQLLARYDSWLQSLLPEKSDILGDVGPEKVFFFLSPTFFFSQEENDKYS